MLYLDWIVQNNLIQNLEYDFKQLVEKGQLRNSKFPESILLFVICKAL